MQTRGYAGSKGGSGPTARYHEATLSNQLSRLRKIILTALSEVESIAKVQQSKVKRNLKLHDEVQRFEIELIRGALQRTNGHQIRAARLLGVKLTTLNMKMKRYKIAFVYQAEDY